MPSKKQNFILTSFLITAVFASLFNVRAVLADGEIPTEPPAATEVPTDAPTQAPVEATPEPIEVTTTPIAEALTQVPEGTDLVLLDESGNPIPLATAEAASTTEIIDPMWCPEGVLPGGPGCSSNFATITALVNNMRTNSSFYDENGIIYFTASSGGSLTLTDTGTSLGTSYDILKNFNLTLQGGWDGISTSFNGQTNFGTSPITIGTNINPWVGNLTLNDILISSSSSTSVTIYTSTGDINLNNVDVNNQGNARNTAILNSSSGDINVANGTYDGNGSNSSGFSATTSGSITLSSTLFTDNVRPSTTTANGATLNAPIVTLLNVTGANNDGSGVFFTGSSLYINGGTFNNNQHYGIEVADPATATIYVQSNPICTGNTLGCYNDTTVVDTPTPVVTPPPAGTPAPTSQPPTSQPPTSNSSDSSSNSSTFAIPLTGGELIRLDCNSVFWAFGIKLSFSNLCDHETTVGNINANILPGKLPDGLSFVQGLNISILSNHQTIEKLPNGASIQIAFPIPANSSAQLAVLHWNGNTWTELSLPANQEQGFYQITATDQIGIFVLAKK